MSRIRFATIRALFESFPEALRNIGATPTDEPPVAFLKRLVAEGKPDQANFGTKAASNEPLTWLALAAGWSSGTFASTPFPVPAHMTARAIYVALLICSRIVSLQERPRRLQICIAEGIRLAETGA
jgi:hypothetical protein